MFRHTLDDRSHLALLEERHAQELLSVIEANRGHLRRWMPWVDDTGAVADVRAFIERALAQFTSGTGLHAGIWHDGSIVGVAGFNRIDPVHRWAGIGYWISQHVEGRGLVTMACRALLKHAFEELGLVRVEIRCGEENHRSRAIPERLGFAREGTLRKAENLYGRFVDHVVYSILSSEWREKTNTGR